MKRTSKKTKQESRLQQLYNGQWVKISGVSPALVEQVQASVVDPPVPVHVDPETGDEFLNSTDPTYVREVERLQDLRQRRAMHAIVLFGLELVNEEGEPIDPPDDGKWERKLKRVGLIWQDEMKDLMRIDEFEDAEDEAQARAESYMLFVAWSGHKSDVDMVMSLAGANTLAQQQAEDTFQR